MPVCFVRGSVSFLLVAVNLRLAGSQHLAILLSLTPSRCRITVIRDICYGVCPFFLCFGAMNASPRACIGKH